MRKKIFTIGLFAIIGAALAWLVYPDVLRYYQGWKMGRDYEKFEQGWVAYFKSDTFGGKTPQETYELYVAALKRGDIDAASKHFYWKKSEEQKKKLEDLRVDNGLEKYIADLPEWGEMKKEEYGVGSTRRFSYQAFSAKEQKIYDILLQKEIIFPAGKYRALIDFELNTQANIWKIYSL